jgi:hypothetical protein
MLNIKCDFVSIPIRSATLACSLGWYGGRPYLGNCQACIAAGRNTPEAKQQADAKAERTHPGDKPRIRGCCDRADQA